MELNNTQQRKLNNVIDTLESLKNGYNTGLIQGILQHLDEIITNNDNCNCIACKEVRIVEKSYLDY